MIDDHKLSCPQKSLILMVSCVYIPTHTLSLSLSLSLSKHVLLTDVKMPPHREVEEHIDPWDVPRSCLDHWRHQRRMSQETLESMVTLTLLARRRSRPTNSSSSFSLSPGLYTYVKVLKGKLCPPWSGPHNSLPQLRHLVQVPLPLYSLWLQVCQTLYIRTTFSLCLSFPCLSTVFVQARKTLEVGKPYRCQVSLLPEVYTHTHYTRHNNYT